MNDDPFGSARLVAYLMFVGGIFVLLALIAVLR